MDHPLARGRPFEIASLWEKPSIFAIFEEDESILQHAWSATFPDLEFNKAQESFDTGLDLRIPDLNAQDEPLNPESQKIESQLDHEPEILREPDRDHEADQLDIWAFDHHSDRDVEATQLSTWEAFEGLHVPNAKGAASLSDAGPAAFDAALATFENSIGVLPQDYALRCLSALVLGRSSSMFSWNAQQHKFEQILHDATISGISLRCSGSLVASTLSTGNQIRHLRTFADHTRSLRHALPALLAFKSCIGDFLDAIDESVSGRLSKVQSLLQLQDLMERPRQLLTLLTGLVDSVKDCRSDESIISALSDRIHEGALLNAAFGAVLQTVLARVSIPWLESLAGDLGFAGSSRAFSGNDFAQPALRMGADVNTSFLAPEDRSLLLETSTAIALLREIDASHPLLGEEQSSSTSRSLLRYFVECTPNPHDVAEAAHQYEGLMISAIVDGSHARRQATASVSAVLPADGSLWQDHMSCDTYVADLDAAMSLQPVAHVARPGPSIHVETVAALGDSEQTEAPNSSEVPLDVGSSPISRLRPLITTQHRLVSGVILRQLLRDQRLRHNLEVQRSFQMFGNGNFVSRMCAALFSEEVQSAERRRDTVPTAETVGLRLGASHDERWPPASSELQLSLMGILTESASGSEASDKLSFAIRELPEEEIERVLDPHSIYALDFLRLQYQVTAPLNAVLTAKSLDHYDEIFCFLLKLLRLVHAASDVSKKVLKNPRFARAASFVQEAQLFLSVVVSHIMDLGIAPPWQELMRSIAALERKLDEEDARGEIGTRAHLGIEGLRHIHEACLDRIRSRLLLKRKHQKLRTAIESAFASLLKAAYAAGLDGFLPLAAKFHQAVKTLVDLLKDSADKPPKSLAVSDAEDAEVLRSLLWRLNWNGHYEDHDQTW